MKSKWKITGLLGLLTGVVILSSAVLNPGAEEPMSAVILSRMNVFYMGVDNPVEIKVNGVPDSLLMVSISGGGGSVRRDTIPGHYIVTVSSATKAIINVSARRNGTVESCGTFNYRIKKIPDPVTYVNDVRHEGVVLKQDLQKLTGVFTRMENFDFDGAFQPQSFSMSVIEDGKWKEYTATGAALTPEMKTALGKAMPEDKILFHNVITKGPDGTIRRVNTVMINVK